MTEITKIALTGGPCAGKTTAVSYIREQLAAHGVQVIAVPEQATALMESGKTPESMGSYAFHSLLFQNQLEEEEKALQEMTDAVLEKLGGMTDAQYSELMTNT